MLRSRMPLLVVGCIVGFLHGCSEVRVIERGGRDAPQGDDGTPENEPGPTTPASESCSSVEAAFLVEDGAAINVMAAADGPGCETWIGGEYAGGLLLSDGSHQAGSTSWDGFVARLDKSGAPTWFVRFEGGADVAVENVAVDGDGNSWVSGHANGGLRVGGELLLPDGDFVVALDADGAVGWARSIEAWPAELAFGGGALLAYGSTGDRLVRTSFDLDTGHSTSVDLGTGSMYVLAAATSSAGSALLLRTVGTFAIGDTTFGSPEAAASSAGGDLIVVGMLPSGEIEWTRQLEENGFDPTVGRIAVDDDGTVSMFAAFHGQVTVDGEIYAASSDGSTMSLLAVRLRRGGIVEESASFGAASYLPPLWAVDDGRGGVAWSALVQEGEIELGDEDIAAAAFPGVGVTARLGPGGTLDSIETVAHLDRMFGKWPTTPIVVTRVIDDLGSDGGTRIARGAL
jgi:hypothetical protein